jgi:hypothetical protein
MAKGWLDNYNDSKVSVPQGFVGDGYDTTGRDYSPAWGGQFEDGGLIPIAQNGKATRADSLDVYNRALKIDAYYENLRKKGWYPKREITPIKNLTSEILEYEMKSIDKQSRETYKKQSEERKEYSRLKNTYPNVDPKKANLNALAEHIKLTKGTKYASKDNLPIIIDPIAPTTVIDTRIIPKEKVHYETIEGVKRDEFLKKYPNYTQAQYDKHIEEMRKLRHTTPPSGTAVNLYRYDPLSVKPWDMLTDAEKKLRVQKYGTDGVPKSYLSKLESQPRIEALNLPPIEQAPINIPIQELDFNTPIKAPKSYDVSMQRYNMQGPSDYYQANEEGVDYETALRAQQAAEKYNADIEKRYGPQNEYRTEKSRQEAARRLEQLKQDIKVTPNYQMGGSVYPVNYVPEAQDGDIIPSDLPDPVNGITYDPEGERTYYDSRLDRIVLAPSSNFAPRQSVINHEKFHKYQFDNLGSNYEITHQGAVPLFKKPSMVSTDEEYYKFHNRKGREIQQDIENVKSNYPQFKFVPNDILFDKIIDREQYSNPYTLEGEAQMYENSLKKFQMGGSIPGSVGFTYARTNDPAPSNGPYAKKTMASAQNGAWLDQYDVAQNGKWLGNKLDKQGYITSETKGGNRISFTGDERQDEWINKQIDSGKFGFNPKTGGTFPLKKPVKGLSKEDQFMATKQYHDLIAPEGFTNESQQSQIDKLPELQQDMLNAENTKRRKSVVYNSMQDVVKNPLFYTPGAIALAPIAAAGLTELGIAASPYITNALATQLPGMAAVPGATVRNAIAAGFAGHGLAHVGPDSIEMYENPSWENAFNVGMDVVESLPVFGPAIKTIGEGLSATGRALGTESGLLSKAYKSNPYALKEAQEQMLVRARPVGQDPYINMAEQLKAKQAAGEQLTWYQKNLLNPQTNPQMAAREKYFGQWFADNPSDLDFYINPGTRNFADDAQIEILKTRMPKLEAAKYNVKNFEDAKSLSNLHDTEYILPKDMVQQAERYSVDDLPKIIEEYKQINKPHWLKGYKQISKQPPSSGNVVGEIVNKSITPIGYDPFTVAAAPLELLTPKALKFKPQTYATKNRFDAWRLYNGLEPEFNTFLKMQMVH